jgi:hypothetical protein
MTMRRCRCGDVEPSRRGGRFYCPRCGGALGRADVPVPPADLAELAGLFPAYDFGDGHLGMSTRAARVVWARRDGITVWAAGPEGLAEKLGERMSGYG